MPYGVWQTEQIAWSKQVAVPPVCPVAGMITGCEYSQREQVSIPSPSFVQVGAVMVSVVRSCPRAGISSYVL